MLSLLCQAWDLALRSIRNREASTPPPPKHPFPLHRMKKTHVENDQRGVAAPRGSSASQMILLWAACTAQLCAFPVMGKMRVLLMAAK
jgi:hypothetical protein